MTIQIPFDNSYARLPQGFYARVAPTPVRAPRLIRLNRPLAEELGLDPDALSSAEGTEVLAGQRVPEGAEPLAMAYAGHQFGQFVPQLGDGRAILLGEVVDRAGQRRDIQLKGAGMTPYSRRGDGRAALGPVLREYVVSEAMAALGIPTTRSLAAVLSGDAVIRDAILPGAVLTRVASSHIRVGTFQFFAARRDTEGLKTLADHVIARHYPQAADAPQPYVALLAAVIDRQAALIARWLNVGFIHGVMNTDNMSIAGETIDYGPCAFLDAYDPNTVFSSIDHGGRYAFGNQPQIGQWNLTRFAECLLPLIDTDLDKAVGIARETLAAFVPTFEAAYLAGLRQKCGLFTAEADDAALIQDLLDRMAQNGLDFTNTFRSLAEAAGASDAGLSEALSGLDDWLDRWRARLSREARPPAERAAEMRRANPAFIPRNHRIEAVIAAAVEADDYGPFETLIAVLSRPSDDQPEHSDYAAPPTMAERVTQTFCGT